MKKLVTVFSIFIAVGTIVFQSCKEETSDPPKASIFYSVVDKQVAFTALTKRVISWKWEFGDGLTSTEQNPVHVYEGGGYYTVTLSGTDENGTIVTSEVTIAVSVTPYVLLTGGPNAANGKTWKLTANHSSKDKLSLADAAFSLADPDIPSLPQGVFGLFLGIGEVYDDEYTFYYNGDYSSDTKADHGAFAGLVNQMLTNGGAGVISTGTDGAAAEFGMCTAAYTPETNATFTYVEKENFTIASVWGAEGTVTYQNVSTLDFSGTEFVGFMDYQRKVILQDITDNTMRLVMFMTGSPDYYPLNTHALILSFEVVN
ncbi:MAG: PKD domain-containing protein [Bacteroidales bacterium]|nr:PKD domain-containing protein [Bacteroidales bacterium]MBK8884922.1 PKD domain-containing protein [Bacteroidales bacterium]